MKKHPNHEEIDERARLSSPTIYEIVAREGREELARPLQSLAWSGFVAGLCISFSLFGEGFLKAHLPEGNFFLIENLGYTLGFLIVILGRFQLFTENTITVVLPLLEKMRWLSLYKTLKLWVVVLTTNLVGTFFVAWLVSTFSIFSPDMMEVLVDISHHAVMRDPGLIFLQALPAGFLIAALVWMLPSSENFEFWVIIVITYVIAIGDFAHVVAGSVEMFLLILENEITILAGAKYLAAACGGNIVGGTGLFAVLAYAQVQREM